MTPERRSSLLQLVTKLQAGLTSATSDRRHSGQMRFNRRKERSDRHTIGVSNEELADARKLMQEISCPSQSSSKTSLIPKQNSDGSVNQSALSYNPVYQKTSVKNSTPKPFNCSNSASTNSSSVQTPSESMDNIGYLFSEETKEYPCLDSSPIPYDNQNIETQESSQDYNPPIENTEFQQHHTHQTNNVGDSEEDDSSTIRTDNYAKPDIIMQSNPIYYQPNEEEEFDNKKNRFTSRKLKMRRANTIDIPKPLHFYECDDEEETDIEEEERRRRNNYLALRGPIRVGNIANRNSVPTLEPKTENDKKFLAFISKHNQKNQRHSLWASNAEKSSIWNNKFDHIKTNFEKRTDEESVSPNSARNFWKASDDSLRFGSKKYDPKISKQSAMNLKRMFEEKQKLSNERRNSITTENSFKSVPMEKNVRFVPQPLPVNKFSHAPFSAFQPVAKNVNEKHIQNPHPLPSSTFRPISQKDTHQKRNEEGPDITKSVLQVNDTQGPNRLFLYSPKPLNNRESVSPTSPGLVKPWVGSTGESRVLTLAAKKFENPVTQPINSFQPRRLSREKINAISNFQQNNNEKMTAPYLVKSLEQSSNTVRKLSGQYDNLGYQPNKFERIPQQPVLPTGRKIIEGFQPKFTVPQNYSIRYDRPKVSSQSIPVQTLPSVHNATPAEVKKYNQMYHQEKQNSRNFQAPRHDHNFSRIQKPISHQEYHKDRQNDSEVPLIYPSYSRKQVNQIENKSHPVFHEEKPKYAAQTVVKQEVYEKPHIEISDLGNDDSRTDSSRPSYVSQSSVESLREYGAINSRVMSGPVAQVASTVKQKSPMTRNEHDMQAAFALKTALQKVNNSPSPNPQTKTDQESSEETPKRFQKDTQMNREQPRENNLGVIYNNVRPNQNYHSRVEDQSRISNRSAVSERHEVTARGEHIVTGKLPLLPSINIQPSQSKPTQAQVLSKSDSWHQICLLNQAPPQNKPAPRSAPNARNIMKSKSTHSVIPPKQFEAGMSKEEIAEKKRTMESFFGGNITSQQQSKSPSPGKVVKRAINRTKTSEKNVQYKMQIPEMPTGLARSRTLPDIVCVDLLDENNVDQAFEDLFTSS